MILEANAKDTASAAKCECLMCLAEGNNSSHVRRASEPETAREVLIELFEEETIESPDELADLVIARLGSRGFLIIQRDRQPS